MIPDQRRRTLVLLETLLDYLPGPQMMRSQADDTAPPAGRSRVYTIAELDRQIAHLEHQERLRSGDYSAERESWQRARREQYRQGDYAALDLALAELEVVSGAWSSLCWRVATHHPGVLDQPLRVELVRAVSWLAGRLPVPVRVPAWTTPSALPTVAALLALRDMGVPFSVLERVYGKDAATLRRKTKRVREIA